MSTNSSTIARVMHVAALLAAGVLASSVPRAACAQQAGAQELKQRETAAEECAADRRCRIDRMKRSNTARRRQEYLEAEEQVRRYEESLVREEQARKNRLLKPWATDFYLAFNLNGDAMVGFSGGYAFSPNFRVEGVFAYQSAFLSQETTLAGQPVFLDGALDLLYAAPMATYMVTTGWLTPYVSGGLMLGRGRFQTFGGFLEEGGGPSFGSGSARVHLAHLGLGLDAQFKRGLRAKFGGVVRRPILVTVTDDGAYSSVSSEAAQEALRQSELIGFELSFGWAF
ncbi:MAG: hypothetical protein AAGI01_06115 [Myxococcota bacterium]